MDGFALRARLATLALVGALVFAAGCGDREQHADGAPRADRYARRVQPIESWIPESQVPEEPQDFPEMVMWEVSQYPPGTQPTPEHEQAARDLIERCHESALRHGWNVYEKGLADGFEKPPRDPRHYRNPAFLLDGVVLDPDRPEYLMYYPVADGKYALAGFMFLAAGRGARGPQVAGPLTVWHFHVWRDQQCAVNEMISVGFAAPGEKCEQGVGYHRSVEMMHVWLVDHPQGPFATPMNFPRRLLAGALEKRMRERGY
jgi:hypothetical protein